MSLIRRAKKRDANERAMLDVLAKAGAYVIAFDSPFDLLVGLHGEWLTLEIKNPDTRSPLTKAELDHKEECELRGLPHEIVYTVDDLLDVLRLVRTN